MTGSIVFHKNTSDYAYMLDRERIVLRIRAVRGAVDRIEVEYFDRAKSENRFTKLLNKVISDDEFDYYETTVEWKNVVHYIKYFFKVKLTDGEEFFYLAHGGMSKEPTDGFFEYLYANPGDVISHPDWAKGAVYYQIFPERFSNGNHKLDPEHCEPWGTIPTRENFMGGDLAGITEKLDYIESLGVTCLYINPIFKADFNHKYATTDYFDVDPQFGTKEELVLLVKRAHERGIRVLLDGVFNHSGVNFEQFLDVRKNGEKSRYKNWFFINRYPVEIEDGAYECVGDYKYMPKLNTSFSEVRKFIISVLEYWIEKADIDGWRLDVADEVDSEVWYEARAYLKEKYPDILLLGETWGYGGSLLDGRQMDCTMNYPFRDAVRDYFANDSIGESSFADRLGRVLSANRTITNHVQYNLLDSHDTERFKFLCGENKRKHFMAIAMQFLFPGAPAIYYGDEAGMTGENDPDCRRCMVFGDEADSEYLRLYRELAKIKREHEAVRTGDYRKILFDDESHIVCFERFNEDEQVMVLMNNSDQERFFDSTSLGTNIEAEDGHRPKILTLVRQGATEDVKLAQYSEGSGLLLEPYCVKILLKEKKV